MKKLLMLSCTALTLGFGACAQKLDASKVPVAVKLAFAKQFPTATAKWEKEDGKYEAGFKQDGEEMSALFDTNGTMTESEVSIKVESLLVAVKNYVADHYKGKKIKAAAKITKADGTVTYEAEVNGMDVIFDADGKYLKEVKD